MSKSKKAMYEAKEWERKQQKNQYEWSLRRGVNFPLDVLSQQQWHQEWLIQQRFWWMKNIHEDNRHNATLKPAAAGSISPAPWPLWTYFEIVRDGRYHLMSKEEMDTAVAKIEYAINSSISSDTDGYTKLTLSPKAQSGKESCCDFAFGKSSFMVSPSWNTTKYLYIGADKETNAVFYAGYDIADDVEESSASPMIGFLVVTDENNHKHAVWLEEFSALVEVKEDKEYIFTFYNKDENMLFIKHLTSLENDNLFSDRDMILNTDSNEAPKPVFGNALNTLTEHEHEILNLMLEDMLFIKIAKILDENLSDIHACKRSIYSKLKISSKAELISLATKQN